VNVGLVVRNSKDVHEDRDLFGPGSSSNSPLPGIDARTGEAFAVAAFRKYHENIAAVKVVTCLGY
jgi:hypothetical protein